MAKQKRTRSEELEPAEMPSSITELQPIIEEFVKRYKMLENEETNLKEQKAELVDEYSDRLDSKTLKLAMRAVALEEKVQRKDTFDTFVEVLKRL